MASPPRTSIGSAEGQPASILGGWCRTSPGTVAWCFRRQWPWWPGPDDVDYLCSKDLSVHRKELRFPMADFGGLDAKLPAFETRAHRARKGRPFGLNLEEYLTSGATKMHSGGAGTWILQWRKRLFHSPATRSHRRRRRRRQIGRMLLRAELTAPPTRQRRESIAKLFVCTANAVIVGGIGVAVRKLHVRRETPRSAR